MPCSAYQVENPDASHPLWPRFTYLAKERPNSLARVLSRVDEFLACPEACALDRSAALRIETTGISATLESYLVPSMYDDPAFILGVDHTDCFVWFIDVCDKLSAPEDDEKWWVETGMRVKAALLKRLHDKD
jgi:hypothetical protein